MDKEIIYDTIGLQYNNTRRADKFLVNRFRHFLHPIKGENYLGHRLRNGKLHVRFWRATIINFTALTRAK